MPRKKETDLERARAASGSFFGAALEEARRQFGDYAICAADEAASLVVGLPSPSLCWEYLLDANVLRFGTIVQILGKPASFKSALTFDLARQVAELGGRATLLENEDKYSPEWANAHLDHVPGLLHHVPAESMEHWQRLSCLFFDEAKSVMDGVGKKRGTGRIWPYMQILDSVLGKVVEEYAEKVDAEGCTVRRFGDEARALSDWFKILPGKLRGYPFLFVFTNHLKPTRDMMGRPVRHRAGGYALSFHETYEFQLDTVRSVVLEDLHHGRRQRVVRHDVHLHCYKNSMGETNRSILISLYCWREIGQDGNPRLQAVWDWHGATIRWLQQRKEKSAADGRELDSIVDLHFTTIKRARRNWDAVWSERLGIPRSKPLWFPRAGIRLMQNQEVVQALRQWAGIRCYKVFQPGIDYRKQQQRGLEKPDCD